MSTSIFPLHLQPSGKSERGERRVVFLLLPNVNLLDLAGPAQVFHTAAEPGLGMPYTLTFCAHQRKYPNGDPGGQTTGISYTCAADRLWVALHLLLRPLFIGLIGLGLALWIERWISVYRQHRRKS